MKCIAALHARHRQGPRVSGVHSTDVRVMLNIYRYQLHLSKVAPMSAGNAIEAWGASLPPESHPFQDNLHRKRIDRQLQLETCNLTLATERECVRGIEKATTTRFRACMGRRGPSSSRVLARTFLSGPATTSTSSPSGFACFRVDLRVDLMNPNILQRTITQHFEQGIREFRIANPAPERTKHRQVRPQARPPKP